MSNFEQVQMPTNLVRFHAGKFPQNSVRIHAGNFPQISVRIHVQLLVVQMPKFDLDWLTVRQFQKRFSSTSGRKDTQHEGISLHLILPSDHTTFTRSHSDESAPFAKLWFLKRNPLTFLPRSSNENLYFNGKVC